MENQVYIPTKLKVGYNKRLDTYSKKLAYVIYYDDKGKLRKEGSWNNWIEPEMGIDEFENVPMEGFVLNRNVGGAKQSYGWDVRIEKVRVYDPRGFEFEIDLPNVLFILQECTSTRGKGLEGSFVYGWNGPNLVLLPTSCEEYRKSKEYTNLQSIKISAKELIVGASYKTKKQEDLIYLGKFEWFERNYRKEGWVVTKKFVFVNENAHISDYEIDKSDFDSDEEYEAELIREAKEQDEMLANGENYEFIPLASVNNLALCNSEVPVANYADLLSRFNKTIHAGLPIEFVEEKSAPEPEFIKNSYGGWENKDKNTYFLKIENNKYHRIDISPEYNWLSKSEPKKWKINKRELAMINGNIKNEYLYDNNRDISYSSNEIKKLGLVKLYVKLNNNELIAAKEYC